MTIKVVPDIGAPLAVVAVDLATETMSAGKYNEWAAYILAVGGYVGAAMNFGGDFVKNVGIASLPWAAKKIYNRIKTPTTTAAAVAQRLAYRPAAVSRYPAPAFESEFENVRLD